MIPKVFKIAMDFFKIKFVALEVATSANKTDSKTPRLMKPQVKILSYSKEWAMIGNHCDVGRDI